LILHREYLRQNADHSASDPEPALAV
jgi:hypothetical protein